MKRNWIATLSATALMFGASWTLADVRLVGAGATFPQPLYMRWIAEYEAAHAGVKIDYGGGGSGAGIKGITDKTLDFAGSDAPMSKGDFEKVGGADAIVEIPSCAGGVVPAYNVPGLDKNTTLNFSGEVLANIYMGKITNWNDPAIAAINPGVTLPNLAITPGYRTDGSGTNFVFTNYLATQSDDFKNTVGIGKKVQWPTGQGGKGNPGVAAIVQETAGAIGYIEQNYADQNNIAYGAVENANGKFVKASPEGVTAAGEGAAAKLDGTTLAAPLWNQPGDATYPIASFTYLIVYKDLNNLKSKDEAQVLVDFLWWDTHDGQKLAHDLDYAPLSPAVLAKVEAALNSLTYQGEAIKPTVADAK